MGDRRFGLSTHLFHDHRLTRDHLALVARHGFDAVEVFATRTHFDYRDDDAVAKLGVWLQETHLELHSVHAPIAEAVRRGEMVVPYSTASGDEARRIDLVQPIEPALAHLLEEDPRGDAFVSLGRRGKGAGRTEDREDRQQLEPPQRIILRQIGPEPARILRACRGVLSRNGRADLTVSGYKLRKGRRFFGLDRSK